MCYETHFIRVSFSGAFSVAGSASYSYTVHHRTKMVVARDDLEKPVHSTGK